MKKIYAGIEAGGTKFVCAAGNSPDNIIERAEFPTTLPEETLNRCLGFFRKIRHKCGNPAAIGIGSFGPVDPDPESPSFGYITSTPKPGWKNTDIAGFFNRELNIPAGFDTDVNAAALGEGRWGAAEGISDYVYITVGTGIGGGVVVNNSLIHGLTHPEIGHMPAVQDVNSDPFSGICPYHSNCIEGLASGPAIEKRWGKPAKDIAPDHITWEIEAEYLAQLAAVCLLFYSSKRIIFGGGVMKQEHLLPMIREKVPVILNGYINHNEVIENTASLITVPGLKNNSGICGTFILAEKACQERL